MEQESVSIIDDFRRACQHHYASNGHTKVETGVGRSARLLECTEIIIIGPLFTVSISSSTKQTGEKKFRPILNMLCQH